MKKTASISRDKRPPFFSVVVATYNRAQLIQRALDSLIAQTETDWEAVIVDDGSTDGTYEKISHYLSSYPNMRYMRKSHEGEAATKNVGINTSTGVYVTFLDSDDAYDRNHLKHRRHLLDENPLIEFLHGGLKIIGKPFVPNRFDPATKIHLKDCVAGGTFFIERNVLLSLNGFDEIELGTDADLFDRATKAGIRRMQTDLPTYIYYRDSPDSITNQLCADC